MGVEAVKSSTPQVCRDKFKEIFKIILLEGEQATQQFLREFRKHFSSLPPEEVSFPRGVSDIDKWYDRKTIYKKACPIHVRGALLYNNQVSSLSSGEKSRFLYQIEFDKLKKHNLKSVSYTHLTLPTKRIV